MKHFGKLALLGAALAVSATYASATTISFPTVTTASYIGTLVVSTSGIAVPNPTVGDPNPFHATYTESVYSGGTGAMCPTCLNFVYTISNSAAAGAGILESFSTANFGVFNVTGGMLAGANGISAGSDTSGVIHITFQNALAPGMAENTFVLFTNATSYGNGTMTFQDGTTVDEPAFVPGTPEPSSLMLLGTGLLSAGGMLMRRRRLTA